DGQAALSFSSAVIPASPAVTPAKAGVPNSGAEADSLDPGFRRGDGERGASRRPRAAAQGVGRAMENYLVAMLVFAGLYGLMALGLNVIWGMAGMINLGLVGFFAVGGYAS